MSMKRLIEPNIIDMMRDNIMKEKLLIVGSGGFGRVTLEHAMKDYDCAFVDDGYAAGNEICGVKIIGSTSQLIDFCNDFCNLVISIGNNQIREKIYTEAKSIGYKLPNIICGSAYISPFATLGDGCVILNNVVIQNGAHVGNGVILNPGVEVHHDSNIGDFVCIYTNSVIRTYATIKDNVKIGSNVTISNNVTVKESYIVDDGETVKA